VAMLLRISDAARRPASSAVSATGLGRPAGAPVQLHGAETEVIKR
jgi:hypothetical protein